MADESGPLSGVVKSLNDARYVPALFGVLLVGLILFSPKESLTEDTRRKALAAVCIFTLGAAVIGFVHNHFAWRAVNAAKRKLTDEKTVEHAQLEPIHIRGIWTVVGAYAVIAVLAIACLIHWLG